MVDISWYDEQRTTAELAAMLLSFPILLGGLFGLRPLFLLAGWLSARTVARRGADTFVRSRLIRLGIPLVVFTYLIDPVADWLGKRFTSPPPTLADALLNRTGTRDMGPLWFVGALLVFSLAYAAVRAARPAARRAAVARRGIGPPTRALVVAGAVIAVGSFVTWLRWPHMEATPMNVNWPHWPQAATTFTLSSCCSRSRCTPFPGPRR